MPTTNHQPWDNGIVDAAFKDVLGVTARELNRQKTVKARCGRRDAESAFLSRLL